MKPTPNILIRFITGAVAATALALSSAVGARAQNLTFTLDPNPAIVVPGSTLTLLATLTNDGPNAFTPREMNGNTDAPSGLTWDYDDFFLGLETLNEGDTYSANVYLNADPSAPLGNFVGTLGVCGEDPMGAPINGSAELPFTLRAPLSGLD